MKIQSTVKVRLMNMSAVNNNTPLDQLPIQFEGTLSGAHDWCKLYSGGEWRRDTSIFGGYYANEGGDCFLLT